MTRAIVAEKLAGALVKIGATMTAISDAQTRIAELLKAIPCRATRAARRDGAAGGADRGPRIIGLTGRDSADLKRVRPVRVSE
jgi:hypothetical protein